MSHAPLLPTPPDVDRRAAGAAPIPPAAPSTRPGKPLPTPAVPDAYAAPVTVAEWRVRRESRCNGIMVVGVVLMLEANLARAPWMLWGALACGIAALLVSILLRPSLPWSIPRGTFGSATGTDHEGRSTTGPFPLPTAPRGMVAAARATSTIPVPGSGVRGARHPLGPTA